MADQRLTDLTELTTPADGDLLYVVDVSDASQSADGSSRSIQLSNARGTPQTSAESSAGVTPTNLQYGPGNVLRYGTNTAALQAAVDSTHPVKITEDLLVAGTVNLASNISIDVDNGVTITQDTNGDPILYGDGVNNVTIRGGTWRGVGAATEFDDGRSGIQALIFFDDAGGTDCSDIRIYDAEVYDCYNGISIIDGDRVWVQNCEVHTYQLYGILGSRCSDFHFDHNKIYNNQEIGGENAYGIMATGNTTTGAQNRCSISFNQIDGVPAWDGIMTHHTQDMIIAFNNITDVRKGIDVGGNDTSQVLDNLIIIGNRIKLTTTDTWGGAAANHGGIQAVGFTTGPQIQNHIVISGNIIEDAYQISGLTIGGSPGPIVVENCYDVTVTGNICVNIGTEGSSKTGVFITGDCRRLSIQGNVLQGEMDSGGIRINGLTAGGTVSVDGNCITQDSTSDIAVWVTGSTIADFHFGNNPTNGIVFSESTSTLNESGRDLIGTATYDPANLSDGAGAQTSVTVTGAALGDWVVPSFSLNLQGILLTGWVDAANSVTCRFQNETGGAIDLASGTLSVRVIRNFEV